MGTSVTDDWSAAYGERATGTIETLRPPRGCSHDWQPTPGALRSQVCALCSARAERDKNGRITFYASGPAPAAK